MLEPTFKFLASGAVAPISGFQWPEPHARGPGAWLETHGALEACQRGAHVCRLGDLAYWIHDELWEAETDGDSIAGFDCLVVRRARLVRRIDSWQNGGATRFLTAAVDHAAELVQATGPDVDAAVRDYLEDARSCIEQAAIGPGAFIAALAVSKSVGAGQSVTEAYCSERSWQASWIAQHVIGN